MKLFGSKEYPFYVKAQSKKKKTEINQSVLNACAEKYKNVDPNDHAHLLFSAAHNGQTEDLRMLFNAGLDPELLQSESHGALETVLTVAAHANRIEAVRFLVEECGLNPLYMGTGKQKLHGNTFHAACLMGRVEIVKLLCPAFERGLSERSYRTNTTPIVSAISKWHFACARELIENGFVDVNQNCMNGLNILGAAFSCFVTIFIEEATSAQKNELVAFCLFLIDEKGINPFAAVNGNRAAIDVLAVEKVGVATIDAAKSKTLIGIANDNNGRENFSNDEKKYDFLYLMLISLNIVDPEGQPLAQKLFGLAQQEYKEKSSVENAKRYRDAYTYFQSQHPILKTIAQAATSSQSTSTSLSSSGEQS